MSRQAHKGSPHTASAGPGCDVSTKHLFCRVVLHIPCCSSSPCGPAFHPSFQDPRNGNLSLCPGKWRHPSGCSAAKGTLLAVPFSCKQALPSALGSVGRGPCTQPTPLHALPMAYKRPAQFWEMPGEKKLFFKQKTKGSTLPKHCLHKSLSFSFFFEAVEYCLFSSLSETSFLEKLLFL